MRSNIWPAFSRPGLMLRLSAFYRAAEIFMVTVCTPGFNLYTIKLAAVAVV